jgi:hypothetical protein
MFSKSACLIVLSGVIVTAPLLSNALFHMSGERYYAFTRAHVDFFALDSNYMDRRGNLHKRSDLTAAAFDQDQAFIIIEAAADTLHFQAISRTSAVVDSGQINRTARVSRLNGSLEAGQSQHPRISFLDLNRHAAGNVP